MLCGGKQGLRKRWMSEERVYCMWEGVSGMCEMIIM